MTVKSSDANESGSTGTGTGAPVPAPPIPIAPVPIAIVGMACRFAGARDLHEFWEMTCEGRNAFGPVPRDRWDHAAFFDANPRAADRSYVPNGGFIEDIRSFPAVDLQIPPRRLEVMDPQQRFAFELSVQAVEDSGRHIDEVPDRTGVYMGVTATEFRSIMSSRTVAQLMASGDFGSPADDPQVLANAVARVVPSRPFSAPGALSNMIAATVSQELRLHGPAYTTDAACASALVALVNSVIALRCGLIDAALAGGTYICLTPEHHIAFSRIGAISKSGECLPFDARADGFVQGDGTGVVYLKRLDDAVRDGDRVYAVIRGFGINNDGGGQGPMAPVKSGQAEVVQQAWEDAGLDLNDLGYVETHGTGTSVGDKIEFDGLVESIGGHVNNVALGSSKANIGHTMSAAGIAGLIRAVLAVYHRQIPPMAGFESPRDDLGLDESPFTVPTETVPWEGDNRLAGVSSFGFGGTNVHAIIGAYEPDREAAKQAELVLMSAPDEEALRELATRTADAVAVDHRASVAGVVRSWATRRRQAARLGVVASSREELVDKLRAIGHGDIPLGTAVGIAEDEPKVAFLYPGQGAQRLGMLGDIRDRFPLVAETLDELDLAVDGVTELPVTHCLYPERRSERVDDDAAMLELTATENCQPALLAVGVALTRLLEAVGVRPHVTAGHSVGEFTAAVGAGVLSPAEGIRWVARRGRAMAEMTGDRGSMVAIVADRPTVESCLVDGAVIANINHPKQFVISGSTEAVEQVARNAEKQDLKTVRLTVSHGFHSQIFETLDLTDVVDAIEMTASPIPVASCIIDRPYTSVADARRVFREHATSPVIFTGALEQCQELSAEVYLQVGAGGPLVSFARGTLGRDHRGVLSAASKHDDDGGASFLQALAALWVRGVDIDVTPITAEADLASVPPLILPRQNYWCVRDSVTKKLKLTAPTKSEAGREAGEPESPESAELVEEEEVVVSGPSGGGVSAIVMAAVAKASAYPLSALKPEMTLLDDLGFDSMMVADLAEDLIKAVEGVEGIPQELLINSPTIQDLIEFAENPQAHAAAAVDDDEPLSRFVPVAVPTPLPTVGQRQILDSGVSVLLTGPDVELRGLLAERIAKTGAAVTTLDTNDAASAAECDVAIFCGDPQVVPVTAVLSREAVTPDRAGDLIALLDRQASLGATPHVLVTRRPDDPWSEGLAGVVRSVSRDWTDSVCKTIGFADSIDNEHRVELLFDELASTDRSVDVTYSDDGRFVAGSRRLTDECVPYAPSADDCIAITGGARGIGLKLAVRLTELGCRVILVDRGDLSDEAAQLIAENDGRVMKATADVTDLDQLTKALAPHGPITGLVHCAGVLADGPLGSIDPEQGRLARQVKTLGWLNGIIACGSSLTLALGIGSWAGRFGSRHQAHYAAGNATMSALAAQMPQRIRAVVPEFSPWSNSDMVLTIPTAVQSAMRAEGVEFVGDDAGLKALFDDLGSSSGTVIRGRHVPHTTRRIRVTETLSTDTHPYLLDHAIEGNPVLPLAGAAEILAAAAGLEAPFEVDDLTLYQGIVVNEPVEIEAVIDAERAELRMGPRDTLCYRARVRPLEGEVAERTASVNGAAPSLSLEDFYGSVTFHGPKLQGIVSIDGVGEDFVRGRIRTGKPADWIPATDQTSWKVDPLVLDSAMQLSAYVAWTRFERAGTPVSIDRYVQLRPLPDGEITAEVRFGEGTDDRFSGTIFLRDADGALLACAENVVAQLRKVEREDDGLEGFEVKPEWTDPSQWTDYKDLKMRIQMLEAIGLSNPYFDLHQGTARNTTLIGEREIVNYSSYNYLGLSGDPRIREDVAQAMERYGTSVSASRVASGERPFHGELEQGIASAIGVGDAIVFPSGHATNVTTIGHLFSPKDLVLHDELIHDSCLQGIKLSGASRRGFRHDDTEHLVEQLRELRRHYEKVLILIEGAYSMDGDVPCLPRYVEIKERYGCMMMIDEAHSFGTVGPHGHGVSDHFGVDPLRVDIWMGTLSKSLASMGGFIAGSKELIEYLRYTTPGFVYAAGMTPTLGQAAISALRLMHEEPWRVERLQHNARFFNRVMKENGVDTGLAVGESPVVPAITGDSMQALLLAERLLEQGINAKPIIFPAVANDAARLRYFLTALHTEEQLADTAKRTAETLGQIREEMKKK